MMGSPALQWHKVSDLSYNKSMRYFITLLLSLTLLSAPSIAQESSSSLSSSSKKNAVKDAVKEKIPEGIVVSLHVLRGLASPMQIRYKKAVPPLPRGTELPKVKYARTEPPRSIQVRVESMVNGITIDAPPEYDHYGYEIRRLMARVEDPEIYTDTERLMLELKNISKALIIYDYWRKHIEKEITAIDAFIAQRGASSTVYRTLKYNKGISKAFLAELKGWLVHDYALLEMLVKYQDLYTVENDVLYFKDYAHATRFIEIFNARNRAVERINKYQPFRDVLY